MHDTCEDTGIPIETKISEGPCTKLTFLGIEIDSVAMEMRLPDTKLAKLRECLATWQGKKACKKKSFSVYYRKPLTRLQSRKARTLVSSQVDLPSQAD